MVSNNISDKITISISELIKKQVFYEKINEFKKLFICFIFITSFVGFTCVCNSFYNNYLIYNIYKDIQQIKNKNRRFHKKNKHTKKETIREYNNQNK